MTPPIRVLTIGHSYTIAVNRAIVRRLAQRGDFDIVVAAPKLLYGDLRRVTIEPETEISPLRLVGLDVTFDRFPQLLLYDEVQLKGLIGRGGFDVIYIWAEPWTSSAHQIVSALGRRRARVAFWTFENISRQLPSPHGEFERTVVDRADVWLAGAELVYETRVKRGYSAEKAERLLPAVDRSMFMPASDEQKGNLRHELGLSPPVLGFAGRLTEEKGLHVLMSAIERIDTALPWSLLVMGSGPMERDLILWANGRGLAARLRMRLFAHDEVARYLPVVDLLLVPSQTRPHWKEQFGRVIIEAFACGVPVIASDSGEIPFVAGDAAIILPEDNAARWAVTIEAALRTPASLRPFIERGLERCERFSVGTAARRLATIFEKMMEKRAPR